MAGARLRLLAWLLVLAAFLGACTPAVGINDAVTGQAAPASPPPATAAPTAPPPASAAPPAPPPAPQPFALNLYQEGDFVPQYTFDWCVAASIQMAHNLVDDTGGGTWTGSTQQGELWEMARARSSNHSTAPTPSGGRRC